MANFDLVRNSAGTVGTLPGYGGQNGIVRIEAKVDCLVAGDSGDGADMTSGDSILCANLPKFGHVVACGMRPTEATTSACLFALKVGSTQAGTDTVSISSVANEDAAGFAVAHTCASGDQITLSISTSTAALSAEIVVWALVVTDPQVAKIK